MRWLAWLLFVPLVSAQQFVAVVPDLYGPGPGDEGFAVAADGAWSTQGWTISDGEGSFVLPTTDVPAGVPFWVVGNASLWAAHGGPAPDAVWSQMRLGNDGDDLVLLRPDGSVADAFLYGDKGDLPRASQGRMFHLDDGAWVGPWDRRVGQSQWHAWQGEADATFYASPDSGFATLSRLITSSQERLILHVYEFRLLSLADAIVDQMAHHEGLQVSVAVDATPVGQTADERRDTAEVLLRIQEAGGDVVLLGDDRYRNHHLKVLVADDNVAIQSENWVASGVPEKASWGNRGWGVVLHDGALADRMAAWLAEDRGAFDAAAFDLDAYDPRHRAPPMYAPPEGGYVGLPSHDLGRTRYQVVWSPEHTAVPDRDPILQRMREAEQRVWWQQLDIREGAGNHLGWGAEDPYFRVLREQAEAGLDVRVMVAAPFSADDTGNREAMRALAAYGVQTCEFQEGPLTPDLRLHNKGGIFDDTVVVGSMNGNHHSRSENRELSVILDGDPDGAETLFLRDWTACDPGAVVPSTPVPMLLAMLFVVALLRCSVGSRTSSSP